jgi:peptide maturation system protein (TIGR04066 family)
LADLTNKFEYSMYTGKGVKVAVIDSGIDNTHPHISYPVRGIGIVSYEDASIGYKDDFFDTVGHGTACADLILKKAPDCEVYGIKVFNDDLLEADPELIIEAVRWAVDKGIQVINLSLGITGMYKNQELLDVCNYAESKNCILVAADTNDFEDCYPALFENVIGVTGGRIKEAGSYYYLENSPIEFVAKGDAQRIAWADKKSIFLERNSFAAPHITGLVCKIKEKYPEADTLQVREILIDNALKGKAELTVELKSAVYNMKNKFKLEQVNPTEGISWIKKACIYPFNKEMHALIRARDLIPFKIEAVVDVIGKGMVGKDAGEVIGIPGINLKIGHDLVKALESSDTLILSHVDELERLKDKSVLTDILKMAVEMGKNVYHLDPAPETDEYIRIKEQALDKGLIVATRNIKEIDEEYLRAASKIKVKVPVVGVFGTSAQQGKFTTQLALRRSFLKEGYSVAQIGTEPHSELFGFDLGFPIGHNSSINWPERFYISYLHYKMAEIAAKMDPEIFIVGAQSNIIPYDINEIETVNLRSIAFLLGTKPDAYILTVNSIDDEAHIRSSINGLESLGQGKTICLTMSDKEKEVKTVYGRTTIIYRQLTADELKEKMMKIEMKFGLPVVDVVTEEGQQKLFDTVIKYFTSR